MTWNKPKRQCGWICRLIGRSKRPVAWSNDRSVIDCCLLSSIAKLTMTPIRSHNLWCSIAGQNGCLIQFYRDIKLRCIFAAARWSSPTNWSFRLNRHFRLKVRRIDGDEAGLWEMVFARADARRRGQNGHSPQPSIISKITVFNSKCNDFLQKSTNQPINGNIMVANQSTYKQFGRPVHRRLSLERKKMHLPQRPKMAIKRNSTTESMCRSVHTGSSVNQLTIC